MPRKIIHLDLDAFFCAVEEIKQPHLAGKAFAVGYSAEQRGVVTSCSYAARRCGVRSAMPMAKAKRLCPALIIVPPRHSEYSQASRAVMEIIHRVSPLVEQISIDEAFVDVSDLADESEALARRLQSEIFQELGLPSSIGVAASKLVAKMATDYGKGAASGDGPPMAIVVVPPGEEARFLAPLPARALWGVGPKTAARLEALDIRTVGEIAQAPPGLLEKLFGKNGAELRQRAQGIDDRSVATTHEPKSVSQETTFSRDVSDEHALRTTLANLAASVGERLRESHLAGVTIKLKIRYPDFTTLTRQVTLCQETNQDSEIAAAAARLFEGVWKHGQRIRLLGVGVSGLRPLARQLSLWEASAEKERKLLKALDTLHARYGDKAIQRGRQQRGKG
ncbi:MAG: DNA polymerase IV [Anaerolineales bacterium]|nr:DNA polymerase IV [Anaerolineales bacterium]